MRYDPQTPFSPEQLRLLQAMSAWVAVAIANARKVRAVQKAQRSERERIAAHLHDNSAQSLSIIGLKVDQIENILGAALPEETREQLQTVKRISHELMAQVRAAFGELRETQAADNLVADLAGCIESFTETIGLPVEFKVTGVCTLPALMRTQAVQIVREALNNVGRHARASRIQVRLLGGRETVRITVQDNGVGFDLQTARADQRHLGTLLMQERAQRSGGSLLISSNPGHGTEVTLTYPIPQPSSQAVPAMQDK